MTIPTTRWDLAEHLKTEEDIQLYLETCLEEAGDDPAFIVHALGVVARARNMSQLARDTGLSRERLYKALSPGGNPAQIRIISAISLRRRPADIVRHFSHQRKMHNELQPADRE